MGQVAVAINGRTYRFACGDGQEARVAELSAYIQGKLNALGHELGRIGDERLLVMVALMLADELFEARDAHQASAANDAPPHSKIHRTPEELRASVPPKPRQRKVSLTAPHLTPAAPEPVAQRDDQPNDAPAPDGIARGDNG